MRIDDSSTELPRPVSRTGQCQQAADVIYWIAAHPAGLLSGFRSRNECDES